MLMKSKSLEVISKVIRELNSGAYTNEASKRDLFNLRLFEIFPGSKNENKLLEFAKGSERNIKVKTSKNKLKEGFQDVDLGTVTLEWKKNLGINRDKKKGQKELREYTSGKWNKNGYSDSYIGLLTDGLNWIAYSAKCNSIKVEYNENDVELCQIESIKVKDEKDTEFLYNFLYKYLILENKLVINPKVLQERFGENSEINKECVATIKGIVETVKLEDQSVLKYINMWNMYKQYNMDLTSEEKLTVYAQNLYLVVLTRILVARLMGMDECNIDDVWIMEILNGTRFRNHFKIKNFVQEDIYYWIIDRIYLDKFIDIAKKLYFKMSEYDFINTNKDNLLHLIYEEITPKNHRKKYGQKSTDFRLCDNIIDRLDSEIEVGKKYIEPAIGSGSIQRSLIINLKDKMQKMGMGYQEQLEILQKDVVGIDIDPIAIILAKSEWIITNSDIIKKSKTSIEIPIYHADSLFHNAYVGDESKYLVLKLDEIIGKILIEKSIISDISMFDIYLNNCDNLAKSLVNENKDNQIISDKDVKFINKYIVDKTSVEVKLFLESTKTICKYLFNKRKQINNGLWKGLLFNNNIPQLLFKSFDMIISNLPWLALSSLPDIEYTNELKELSVAYKVRATKSSHHHQEIATIFALRCVDKFLSESGVASFVMPGTIISGDHHTLLRKMNFREVVNVNFEELWDIPNEINPFNVKSCVLFMRKGNKKNTFKMRKLQSLSQWDNASINDIKLLDINNKNTWTINDGQHINIDNYYSGKFFQGADLMPRTAVFVQSINNIDEYDNEDELSIYTDDYALNNKNGKKLRGMLFRGLIRKKYIYTTTISEMLLPYHICNYFPKIALPIAIKENEDNGAEEIRFVSNKEMIQDGDILSAQWFEQFDKLEEFQKEFQIIFKRKK